MKNLLLRFLSVLLFLSVSSLVSAQTPYYPSAEVWEKRAPDAAGFDPAKLKQAIDFAIANEAKAPRDMELSQAQSFGREPFGEATGILKPRGDQSGIVIRGGYIVAEWGDLNRVDMSHSVTKSFLSTVVGLAFDRKLIRSLQDRASDYSSPILVYNPLQRFDDFGKAKFLDLFEGDHNRQITWEHLLRQTSDWEGTLWAKPDWADRPDRDASKWLNRPRNAGGTVYEYNDVRVNVLALAALNVWRRPLPQVLKENIMDEIGASNTWRWFGYENSFVVLDGSIVQSVSGGGHWGGGMFISGRDMARFGLLTARNGKWRNRQLLSEAFIKQAKTPTGPEPTYGFMNWFLNTDRKLYPNAPASAFAHMGNGTNLIYVDPDRDLVVVLRWIENSKLDEFIGKLNTSFEQ
jgi:CubicO group peptidase (beta-lactamase class C family)